jgi:hypothetical protein
MRRPLPIFRRPLCIGTAAAVLIVAAISAPAPLLAQPPGDTPATSTVSDIERHIAEAARASPSPSTGSAP